MGRKEEEEKRGLRVQEDRETKEEKERRGGGRYNKERTGERRGGEGRN